MIWLQIYIIGMVITAIEIIIACIMEKILDYQYPIVNIIIIFLALLLWPIFDLIVLLTMINIYKEKTEKTK